jgi:hypothetical protein
MNKKNKDTAGVNDSAGTDFLVYIAKVVTEYQPNCPRDFFTNLQELIEASKNFDEQFGKVTSDSDNCATVGQMETLFLKLRKEHDDTIIKLFLDKLSKLKK